MKNKLVKTIREAIELAGLKDGMTITYRTMDIPNNWQESVGSEYSVQANAGQKVYMNFTTGTGKCE